MLSGQPDSLHFQVFSRNMLYRFFTSRRSSRRIRVFELLGTLILVTKDLYVVASEKMCISDKTHTFWMFQGAITEMRGVLF